MSCCSLICFEQQLYFRLSSVLKPFKIPRSQAILRSCVKIDVAAAEIVGGYYPLAGCYRPLKVMLADLSIEDSVHFQMDTVANPN